MERVNLILRHPVFRAELEQIEALEQNRIFCRHGLPHLLEVARLAQLYNLEEAHGCSKELLYAAALLHDIGRGRQYRDGTPHDTAGVELAGPILIDCGFSEEERGQILEAIGSHRRPDSETHSILRILLYKADKKSRPCYWCPASKECNWPTEKRNLTLES